MTTTTQTPPEAVQAGAPGGTDGPHRHPGSGRYLSFTLRDEVYALDIMSITEIIEYRTLTVVPLMPAHIRGVINLRGRVLPVVDLAARFGQGSTTVARRTSILVVEGHTPVEPRGTASSSAPEGSEEATHLPTPQGLGILVDTIHKVVQLDDDEIAAPPSFGAGIDATFVRGMARLDDDFAVVLDIDAVLALPEPAATAAPPVPVPEDGR